MMRLSYLKTHWTPEDVHAILSLLDELRDTLWQAYGNEITEHYQQLYAKSLTRKTPGAANINWFYLIPTRMT